MMRQQRSRQRRVKSMVASLVVFLLLISGTSVQAVTIFEATLSGVNETPPNASPAIGFGTFVLNDPMTALSFDIDYQGLIGGSIVGAHFHNGPAGVAAPIVRGLDITGATSPNGSFTGVWSVADSQPLTPFLVSELFADRIYFNIHTTVFPGGEIRGQLTVIPEPSALLLLGSGLVVLALRHRPLISAPRS